MTTRTWGAWNVFAGLAALLILPFAASAGGEFKVAFNTHCRTCHSAEPGDHRLGPSLHGVMGRKAGSADGYSYSPGFQTTDLVWTEALMDQFIANPNSLFPGNNMATFAGLSNAEDRRTIIAYLKSLQ